MIAGQGLNGGMLSEDGPTFISSIGWDWVPGIRDRNTGIWQDVKLKTSGDVIIGDPLIITDLPLPDTTRARISVSTDVRNISSKPVSGKLIARIGNIEVEQPYILQPQEAKNISFSPDVYEALNIANPRLWWPNGYGRQELYELVLDANAADRLSDKKTVRFGIREMSYELMVNTTGGNVRYLYTPVNTKNRDTPVFDYQHRVPFDQANQLPTLTENADVSGLEELPSDDPVGPFLAIRVNGVRIFCRGGNWGMDDAVKRVSRERLEPYFRLHSDAGFNIVRNWTGESTEEMFYTLCDEYGMLVWNDFWITTDDTVEPNDVGLFMNNATDVVRRYRNHPSIAIWCPRNEGFAPKEMASLLPQMAIREDPTRHYHGQSRFLNMVSSGPWGYYKDPSLYYTQLAKGFLTEIGTFAIPTANTIRKFIAPEDQWPINDVWAYHDLHHTSQNFKDFMQAVNRYGDAVNMDDFVRKAQFVTYDAWRNIMEAWNSKMWNTTTGQILWMSHPAWPSMIWQTYTYDYETPGSYFGAKKACESVHIQMNLPDKDVIIANTTRENLSSLTASVRFVTLKGQSLYAKSGKFDAAANSITKCFTPAPDVPMPSVYLARLELKTKKGQVVSVNDYWVAADESAYAQFNDLPNVSLKVNTKMKGGKLIAEVYNPTSALAVAIKLNAVDNEGNIILPAYFSDGYFNLLPGEKREIGLDIPDHRDYSIVAGGYNVK